MLWTSSAGEYEIVDVHAGRGYSFIGAHPEPERDRLSSQIRSQIDHCINITTGIADVGNYHFMPANRTYQGIITNQPNQNYDTLVSGDVAPPYVH